MKKLSIVIPVYNEMATIREILARVLDAPLPEGIVKEIVVVNDGSTDGSREILDQLTRGESLKIIHHDHNRGKGAALRTGFAATTGNFVIVQDADLEYDPKEYGKLLAPILEGHADVVYGSRFLGGESKRVLFFWHYVGNRIITLFSNMFTNLNITDLETGYKLFCREVISNIQIEEDRFGFEPEITSKISRMKVRIYEVGIRYFGRTYEHGKKIGWKDGVRAIWCILKYR